MPEMPEVETLARKLRGSIIGKRIAHVALSGYKLRRTIDDEFAARLHDRTIRKILRRGKYIIAELEPEGFWLMHLGMSGRILINSKAGQSGKHTHVRVQFTDSTELEYRDPRRFGLMAFYDGVDMNQLPEIKALGRDPLSTGFNGDWLLSILQRSHQELKSFLLDQRKIAGLGNIYVCESLFWAGIHPQRRCHTVTPVESVRLAKAIREVLRVSIQRRGTSFSDFVDSDGIPGENQYHLKVFQREHEACTRCGTAIKRIVQGNRSTFFCPACQKPNIRQKERG